MGPKGKFSHHIIIKTLTQKKRRLSKVAKEKGQEHTKVNLSELHQTSQQRLWKPEDPGQRSSRIWEPTNSSLGYNNQQKFQSP